MKIDLSKKKILVTGASGSLGSQILFVLHNMGIKPIAHVRETSDTTYIDSLGLEKRVLDLRRRDKMKELMDGIDLVIHTAAYVNFRQDRLTQFAGANVIGAVDLFKAASATGVERFLHVSTIAAVGAIKRKENLDELEGLYSNEKSEFNLDHLHIPYIMTKRAAEIELYKEAKDSKTELVIVNPSIILAPSQTESDRERALRLFGKFIFPEIPIRINMVDLRDVAPGVVSALSMGKNGERYILGGDNICVKEFALAASSELGKIPHLVRIPRKFYDVTSKFNEISSKAMQYGKLSSFLKFHLFFVVPLTFTGEILAGEHNHDSPHSHAATFSNPANHTAVPDGWSEKPIKHLEKYQDVDLVVSLGQQSHPLFYELIPQYAVQNNLKIAVEQGTCGITSGRLLKKKVDVGAYCCPPGKSDRLPGLKFYSLGISPIALVVHPDNPLQNVTSKQAKEIFEGQISNWSEILPGNRQLIKPVGRLHCKKRPGHWRALLNSEDDFSPRLFEVGVIPDMISQVSRSASSIGWETPLMVDAHRNKGDVKVLNIDGHPPSDIEHVLSGKYPLYRSYSLTAWTAKSKVNDEAIKLIEFLRQHIEKIHQEINFIPVSKLRNAGWKFLGDELVGEPGKEIPAGNMGHHDH